MCFFCKIFDYIYCAVMIPEIILWKMIEMPSANERNARAKRSLATEIGAIWCKQRGIIYSAIVGINRLTRPAFFRAWFNTQHSLEQLSYIIHIYIFVRSLLYIHFFSFFFLLALVVIIPLYSYHLLPIFIGALVHTILPFPLLCFSIQ